MIKLKMIFGILIYALLVVSCDDVFEKNIEGKDIYIISPTDSTVFQTFAVTLWWEEIEDASNYRVQVVSPSIENVSYFALDTLLEGANKISYIFEPGTYQWRVRGENSGYKTEYSSFYSFSIDSSLEISDQKVFLTNPEDDIHTNDTKLTFRWQRLPTATSYKFSLFASNFDLDTIVEDNTVEIVLENRDEEYDWYVSALTDDGGESKPSETRQLIIDVTPPSAPELLTSDGSIFSNEEPITLEWLSSKSDRKSDYLFIYDEDKEVIAGLKIATELEKHSYSGDEFPLSTYYWTVRSFDRAGNSSLMSDTSSFIVE